MTRPARPVVFLHIGAMKTGTTYLQTLMGANKENLAEAGYCFPGSSWQEQYRATRDVLGMDRDDPALRARSEGRWAALAAQMLAFDGRACIFSMEFLSFASRRQAATVVASLAGAEVHVVLTVRDAIGALPAQWQTHCRNRGTVSWPAYARGASRALRLGRLARGEGARSFQEGQGVPRMLRAWASVVPPGHLHVVTLPPPGSDPGLLWERFASVLGVDPAVCTERAERTNPSLGQPSADLMRRINRELGRIPLSDYLPTLRAKLANKVLAARSGIEPTAQLDRRTWRFALRWNRKVRRAVRRSGARLVGDLGDLPVRSGQTRIGYLDTLRDPSEPDLLAAAVAARDGLLAIIGRRAKLVTRRGGSLGALPDGLVGQETSAEDSGRPTPERWSDEADPVAAAVTELAVLARQAIELHRRAEAAKTERSTVQPPSG